MSDYMLVRAPDGTEYRLRIQPTVVPELPDEVELDLAQALIPMFLWRSVPVLVERSDRISLIERFALEAAKELGTVTADELADVTALPERAVRPLLRRLLAAGAFDETETDAYVPAPVAEQILAAETITVLEEATQDFAYLPEHDALLTLTDAAAPWRKYLFDIRMRPVLWMPVDEELWDQPRSELINRHLAEGTARWRPAELFRAQEPPGEELIGDLCPVYEASPVRCRWDDGYRIELTFCSASRPRKRYWTVKAELSHVDALVRPWTGLTSMVEHPDVAPLLWQALAGPGAPELKQKLTVEEESSPRYAMWLPEAAVRELQGRGVSLIGRLGLRVEDEYATLLISLILKPEDTGAAVLFALDYAAHLLESSPSSSCEGAIEDAVQLFGPLGDVTDLLAPIRVRDRMWELGFYHAVDVLRERDDFGYA